MRNLEMFELPKAAPAPCVDESSLRARWDALLATLKAEYLNPAHGFPWVVKVSGGKDSTFLWHAVHEMLLRLWPDQRTRRVYVVSNDTLVENPAVSRWAEKLLSLIEGAAKIQGLPVSCHITTPAVEDRFWVCVLGKGYPPPRARSQWCVGRLKLEPSFAFVKERVSAAGQVIVLVGSRSDESARRAASVEARGGAAMQPDEQIPGALNWQPVANFTTDEVWSTLHQRRPPWGGNYHELHTLYANARGSDACAMVLTARDADACKGGRFGCYVCTVVETDASMEHYVENAHPEWEALVELRDTLILYRKNPAKRDTVSRDGRPRFDRLGYSVAHGPFTLAARRELLRHVLEAQEASGVQLLTAEEGAAIQAQWLKDAENDAERLLLAGVRAEIRRQKMAREAEEFSLSPSPPEGA